MFKWLVLAVGIAIGVVAGWTAALATRDAGADAVSVADRESTPAVSKTAASTSPAQATSVDIQRLANDLDEPLPAPNGGAADVAALERLLDESNSLPAAERQRIQFTAYLRYAALDPQAAVDRLLDVDANDLLLSVAFAAWAMQDADAALRRAESLNLVQREWASMAVWSVSGAHDDPQRAWQETLASKSGRARSEALRHIAHQWADAAPVDALAAINALPESHDKTAMRLTVLFEWVDEDPDAAYQWAKQQPVLDLVPTLLMLMADDAPLKAIELAMATDAKDRQMAVTQVIGAWAEDDPRAAFEWILSNQSSLQDVSLAAKPLGRIAETAPRQALALAERLDKTGRRLAMSTILEQWAANDAPAAAAWLDSSRGESDGKRVATIAAAYAQQRGEEAFDWVLAQAPEHRGDAMAQVTRELAKGSAQRTLDLVRRIDDPQLYAAAVGSIVSAWASEDPRAARRWIAANADDGERNALYARLYTGWALVDQAEAAANARRHGNRSERDAALAATATSVARQNPDLAERLYAEIQGDKQRRQAARYLAFWWRETDPERAERYRNER